MEYKYSQEYYSRMGTRMSLFDLIRYPIDTIDQRTAIPLRFRTAWILHPDYIKWGNFHEASDRINGYNHNIRLLKEIIINWDDE